MRRRVRYAELDPGMLDDLEPVVDVLVRAYPKRSRNECLRWLLGDAAVDENSRVLLDAARRASRQRIAAERVRADIRAGRYSDPPPICWRAA